MLYGTREFKRDLYKSINDVCSTKEIIILYAGTVGSISRGITTYESDYDVKCLYINGVSTNLIDYHNETDIRYRLFNKDKAYDCIAFWEIRAFINFLSEPYIDRGNSYELFHNVLWLFKTPYSWDPLGIQKLLGHDIDRCVNLNNEIVYHFRIIKDTVNETRTTKNLLRLLHAVLSINWIEGKNTLPPINIYSLISSQESKANFETCLKLLDIVNYANRNKTSIEMTDSSVMFINDYVEKEFNRMIDKGYNDKNYSFESIYDNKNNVEIILRKLKHIMGNCPQLSSEPYLSFEDLCKLY